LFFIANDMRHSCCFSGIISTDKNPVVISAGMEAYTNTVLEELITKRGWKTKRSHDI